MNKRILIFFSAIIILIVTLTGCVQYKIAINMHYNNINRIKFDMAFNEALISNMDKEGKKQFDSMQEQIRNDMLGIVFPGIYVVDSPLSYEDKGYVFNGTSYEFTIEDNTDYTELNSDPIKIIPLNNNQYRIEINFDFMKTAEEQKEIEGSLKEINMTIEEYEQLFIASGAKTLLTFTTNNKVLSHNADEVIDGEYIWDLTSESINISVGKIPFIEYELSEKTVYADAIQKKDEFIKKYNLDTTDPDFYGKALQNVNVLFGTNKGLELDSELIRLQGALVYARLLSLEDKISEFTRANPNYDCGFTDVPDWAKPTMNYLFYNKLVYGKGNNLYGSYDPMSEAQFTALVLRSLGYSEANKDFVFIDAPQKAAELGFYITDNSGYNIKNKDRLTRRDMSYIAFNSLFIQNKEKSSFLLDNLSIIQ